MPCMSFLFFYQLYFGILVLQLLNRTLHRGIASMRPKGNWKPSSAIFFFSFLLICRFRSKARLLSARRAMFDVPQNIIKSIRGKRGRPGD